MKRILLSLLLTVAFAVPAFSQAMEHDMKGHDMKGHMGAHEQKMEMCDMDRMGDMMGKCLAHADKLGLTEDQIAKHKAIHRSMEKKQVRFTADLKLAEIDLMEIMEVKDFDFEKASLAVRKIEGIKTAHHLEMLKSMKEVRTIMTDEQFKKMKTMMPMMMDGKMPEKKMIKKHKGM